MVLIKQSWVVICSWCIQDLLWIPKLPIFRECFYTINQIFTVVQLLLSASLSYHIFHCICTFNQSLKFACHWSWEIKKKSDEPWSLYQLILRMKLDLFIASSNNWLEQSAFSGRHHFISYAYTISHDISSNLDKPIKTVMISNWFR